MQTHTCTQKKKIVSTGAIPTAKPYPKMTKASHVRNFRLLSLYAEEIYRLLMELDRRVAAVIAATL